MRKTSPPSFARFFPLFVMLLVSGACETKVKSSDSCGDDYVDPGEACDGAEFAGATCGTFGFYQGALLCRGDCTIDTSGCSENCGDGVVQVGHEQCEDQDFQGVTCVSLGYTSGPLVCTETCARDESGCVAQCGDGVVNTGQACDDGNTADGDGCSALCALEEGWNCAGSPTVCASICGDGLVVGSEACDDGVNEGSYGGCMPGCGALAARCGDGVIDAGEGEVCEGPMLQGATCVSQGFATGALACDANCAFDTTGCHGKPILAQAWGGTGADELIYLAVDAVGNVYLVGAFSSTVTFGTTTLEPVAVGDDGFVVKMDPNGAVVWARAIASVGSDSARAVAVDDIGNVYVGGRYGAEMTLDTGVALTAPGGIQDGFVVKLDPDGVALWARRIGGSTGSDVVNDLALDAAGNVVVTGTVGAANNQPVHFDGLAGDLSSGGGGTDLFLARYGADGVCAFARLYGGSADETAAAVAVGAQGQLYLAGTYRSPTVMFGTASVSLATGPDVFLVRTDSVGDGIWARSVKGAGLEEARGLALRSDGGVALLATFTQQVDCAGQVVTHAGSGDALAAVFDAAGAYQWHLRVGGTNTDNLTGAVFDPAGNLFLQGGFLQQTVVGASPVMGFGVYDLLGVRIDPTGNVVWALAWGDASQQYAGPVARLPDGRVLFGGRYAGTFAFGDQALPSANNMDVYLAWLLP
jgi:cysteine-rich repeat protein